MENLNYQYISIAVISIIVGTFYLINLTRRIKNDKNRDIYDVSLYLKGYAGGVLLIIIGVIILIKEYN